MRSHRECFSGQDALHSLRKLCSPQVAWYQLATSPMRHIVTHIVSELQSKQAQCPLRVSLRSNKLCCLLHRLGILVQAHVCCRPAVMLLLHRASNCVHCIAHPGCEGENLGICQASLIVRSPRLMLVALLLPQAGHRSRGLAGGEGPAEAGQGPVQ